MNAKRNGMIAQMSILDLCHNVDSNMAQARRLLVATSVTLDKPAAVTRATQAQLFAGTPYERPPRNGLICAVNVLPARTAQRKAAALVAAQEDVMWAQHACRSRSVALFDALF